MKLIWIKVLQWVKTILKTLFLFIENIIYPQSCPICGQLFTNTRRNKRNKEKTPIHPHCRDKLIPVTPPVCLRCGKPVFDASQEYCMDCSRKMNIAAFDGGASVWVYTKEMMDAIAMYKYQGKKQMGRIFAQEAVKVHGQWIRDIAPDCITCVPLNRKKQRKRGYNQAEVLARHIGRMTGIPVDNRLLRRTRFTEPQKSLDVRQRMKNLMQAFAPGTHAGRYKIVLLVDDIYTTGSTMQVCSMILKKCGVEKVYIFSLCIGSDY